MIESVLDKAKKLQYFGDQQSARKVLQPFRFSSRDKSVTTDHAALELAFGDSSLRESRFIQAGKCYAQALEFAESLKNKNLELRAKLSLARVLFHQKDFKNALDRLYQILKEARKVQLKAIEAESVGLIGEIKCIDERNFNDSRKLHEESLKLFEQIDDEYGIADQISNLARVFFNLKDIQKAYDYFQDSLQRFKKIGDRNQVAIQMNNIAIVSARALRFEMAIDLFKQALKVRQEIGNYAGMANIQENIAHIYHFSLNNREKAIKWYKKAIESLEVIRHQIAGTYKQQESYIGEFFEVYQKLVDLLCQKYFEKPNKNVFNDIFQYTERAKAYVLLSKIQSINLNDRKEKILRTDDEKIKLLSAEIDSLSREILKNISKKRKEKNTEIVRNKVEKELELSQLELSIALRDNQLDFLQPATIPTFDELQKNLIEKDEILLSYYITLFHVYCLEISPNGFRLHQLGDIEQLNALIRNYKQKTEDFHKLQNDEKYIDLTYTIWRFLTSSGKVLSNPAKTHIICPDTIISHIAFEGLPSKLKSESPQYLGLHYRILYHPSVSFLINSRMKTKFPKKQKFDSEFFGIANPDNPIYPELKNAEVEIDSVKKMFNHENQLVLKRKYATKTNFKNAIERSILCMHFATHGIVDPDELQKYGLKEPALVLSTGSSGSDDMFLTVSDILEMNIRSKLVILSACVTGTGEILRGEGINSLARSFLGAGVDCVVASLWHVFDDFCKDFMIKFYEEMKSQSILDAFFKAKLTTAKEYPNPMDWASFIIVGNAQQRLKSD